MIVEPRVITTEHLAVRHAANAPNERTPGLHLSDVIKSIMCDLQPKRFDKSRPLDLMKFEFGFAFEAAMEFGLSLRHPGLLRPGEIECDGILCSPDGVDIEVEPWRGYEYKFTKMKAPPADGPGTDDPDCNGIRNDPRFFHWWCQIKCYAHAMALTDFSLVAGFINGDYREGPASPEQIRAWDISFNPRDTSEAWAMVLQHARSKGMLPRG